LGLVREWLLANRRIIDEKVADPIPNELGRQGRKLIEKTYNFARFKLLLKNCYDKLPSS
jgi:hypothetical protein